MIEIKGGENKKSSYTQKSQRYASHIHYTVTPIKNNDLATWKAEQIQKEIEYQDKMNPSIREAYLAAIRGVEEQNSRKLTQEERQEIQYINNLKMRKEVAEKLVRSSLSSIQMGLSPHPYLDDLYHYARGKELKFTLIDKVNIFFNRWRRSFNQWRRS